MRTKPVIRRLGHAVLAVVLTMLAANSAPAAGKDTEQIELKVLYAGNAGSDRSRDFETFLGLHFAEVATADYSGFQKSDADDYDVVIFDWTTIYPRDAEGKIDYSNIIGGISRPKPPELTREFDRPTILIGAGGGGICNRLNIAINWK